MTNTRSKSGRIPWNKGKPPSEETRLKQSIAYKAKWADPAYRAKMKPHLQKLAQDRDIIERRSAKMRGRSLSKEHCEKVGAASKAFWASTEGQAKMMATRLRGKDHPNYGKIKYGTGEWWITYFEQRLWNCRWGWHTDLVPEEI